MAYSEEQNKEKKDLVIIASKIKEIENDLRQKIKFCKQHNMGYEAQYLEAKLVVANSIRYGIESVTVNNVDVEDIKFYDL